MKTYMIWIPGKIIGIWDNPQEALQGFNEYMSENAEDLNSIKMTVYERTHEYGAKTETMFTGDELMELAGHEKD